VNAAEREEFLTTKNEWVNIFRALGIEETVDYNPNPANCERVLCVCRGGNCRSVAVAFLLKYKYKKNALAFSLEKNDDVLLRMLTKSWAEKVIVTEPDHWEEYYTRAPWGPHPILVDLLGVSRWRGKPFEVDFLLQVDKLLQAAGFHA
jgi:hypothetical protein